MTDVVIIVRTHKNEDIIAIAVGDMDGYLRIEYPFYVKYDHASGNVGMIPYCALSDEISYRISRDKIDFIVTANNEISNKFLDMVDKLEQAKLRAQLREDDLYNALESAITKKAFVDGNDTKH